MNENIHIEKEEEKKTGRLTQSAKNGLKLVAVAGIGCAVIGFKLGYRKGARDGIIYSQEKFYNTMKELASAVNGSREE